jgi:hypothetical protein
MTSPAEHSEIEAAPNSSSRGALASCRRELARSAIQCSEGKQIYITIASVVFIFVIL